MEFSLEGVRVRVPLNFLPNLRVRHPDVLSRYQSNDCKSKKISI